MSNMVINTNILALNSHRNAKNVGALQAKASARLSSGLKINTAADDAAGLAISEKMRAQIRGLDMASKNSQDAVSLIQTAEGGMQEIDNMLQRIRELTVQASNDTNEHNELGTGDRQKMQDEVEQLVAEIDSMAERIEFNKKKVINGDYEDPRKALASAKQMYEGTLAESNKLQTDLDAADLAYNGNATTNGTKQNVALFADALATLNGAVGTTNSIKNFINTSTDTAVTDFTTATATTDLTGVTSTGGAVADITTALTTKPEEVTSATLTTIENFVKGVTVLTDDSTGTVGEAFMALSGDARVEYLLNTDVSGDDELTALKDLLTSTSNLLTKMPDLVDAAYDNIVGKTPGTLPDGVVAGSTYPGGASGTGKEGFDKAYQTAMESNSTAKTKLDELNAKDKILKDKLDKYTSQMEVATNKLNNIADIDKVGLYFQIGANANQGIQVSIGSVKSDVLGIGDGNSKTTINFKFDSGKDITPLLDDLDEALSYVTSERSLLGATQNRLEYAMKSLDISSENLSAAESRIRDADMAKEMMNLTKANVLQQAANSMLAQANQAPQAVLQLLR